MGVPLTSVMVVTSGRVPFSNSDDTFSTAAAARFDTTPTPLATGYNNPATSTPASVDAPTNGQIFFPNATRTGYV